MSLYQVTITYNYYGGTSPDDTFTTIRKAATPGAAAGAASALFQALSNYMVPDSQTPPQYHSYIIVKSVIVSEVT